MSQGKAERENHSFIEPFHKYLLNSKHHAQPGGLMMSFAHQEFPGYCHTQRNKQIIPMMRQVLTEGHTKYSWSMKQGMANCNNQESFTTIECQ